MEENKTNQDSDQFQFFMSSSHEMRTYVTAIKWVLNMMQKGDLGPLNDEQKEMVTKAKESNDHVLYLIENILTTIRNNKPVDEEPKTAFNIIALIQETISLLQTSASMKEVNIISSFNTGEIVFYGKKNKIYGLLHNFIENAIKYSDEKGTVEIVCEKHEEELVLSVKNNGKTIPEEENSHIFERFFRASNAVGGAHGFGIGLYTAKKVIEDHGGNISFSSKNNETIFTIKMPITQI